MVNIKKVSHEIINDGLYNTLLFEIKENLGGSKATPIGIENILLKNPHYISEYKEINRQSEISSIHVKKLHVKDDEEPHAKTLKDKINDNIQTLKNLENFESDSKNSAYSIWIGSVGVMFVFILHNIIALFTELYSTHATLVYLLFGAILAATYMGYVKIKNNHDAQHLSYQKVYDSTKELIEKGLNLSVFTHNELYD